jgi:hypothetical protein
VTYTVTETHTVEAATPDEAESKGERFHIGDDIEDIYVWEVK